MVLIVLSDYGYVCGGAAQVAISGLNYLASRVDRVVFVSAAGPVDDSIDNDKVEVINFGLHDLLTNPSRFSAAIHGIWDDECRRMLGKVLDGCDPSQTIVHLHSWVKALSSSVVRECSRRGFRIVCTLHDYFSICPNGGLFDYQRASICYLKPMSFECLCRNCDSRNYGYKLWRVARQVVQNKISHIPDGIHSFISVSETSEDLIRPYLHRDSKIYRVRNPIDVAHASPATPELNEGFLFVGRLSWEKGGSIFAESSKNVGAMAKFAGVGEDEKMIRQANPSAYFLGWLGRELVLKEISSCRALVFPSLWYETQGLVVQEAAALGIPSIVSDSTVARDAIEDCKTGLLFRAGDVGDLSDKLRRLKNSPRLAARLGRAAYAKYWEDPPTIERHIEELMHCYDDILAGD